MTTWWRRLLGIPPAIDLELLGAVRGGDLPRVKQLLSAGANSNARAKDGWAPLALAVSMRRADLVDCLLQAGADKDEHRRGGWTPLMRAVECDHDEAVDRLLAAGASCNITASNGTSALILAKSERTVRALLAAGARLEGQDGSGGTALFHAATSGRAEVVKALAAAGANVEARATLGYTPLLSAILEGREEVIECLVAAGADANALGGVGESALVSAVVQNLPRAVACLLAAGARQDIGKSPPLDMAAFLGRSEIVAQLLAAGSSRASRANALALAKARQHWEAVEVLERFERDGPSLAREPSP